MKAALLILWMLLPVAVVSQQSIIVYRTADDITVGIDGNHPPSTKPSTTQIGVSPGSDQPFAKEKNYYFVIAGIQNERMRLAAVQSCREARTLAEVLMLYKEKTTKTFAEDIYNCKLYYPEYYRNAVLNKYNLSIAFFGIENDTLKAAKLEFYIKDKINGGITIETSTWLVPGKNKMAASGMALGKKDAFTSIEVSSPEINSDPMKEIERLMRKQIKSTGGMTGFPIQIITLKKDQTPDLLNIYY